MKNTTKGKLIKGAAVLVDVAVPLTATFAQFPMWVEKSSEATMSGLFLIFAMLSALPFLKQIKAFAKSPSVWLLWVVIFVSLIALRNIIDEMIIVCFAGAIANIVGAGIYKVGTIIEGAEDKLKPPSEAEDGSETEEVE